MADGKKGAQARGKAGAEAGKDGRPSERRSRRTKAAGNIVRELLLSRLDDQRRRKRMARTSAADTPITEMTWPASQSLLLNYNVTPPPPQRLDRCRVLPPLCHAGRRPRRAGAGQAALSGSSGAFRRRRRPALAAAAPHAGAPGACDRRPPRLYRFAFVARLRVNCPIPCIRPVSSSASAYHAL